MGEIKKMMRTVLLGDIADINMGQSPKSEFYNQNGEGIPFMQGVRTFGDTHPKIDTWCTQPTKIAERGDVLFSVRAPVGDINFAPERMCIGRGLASLKSRNNQFLYYLLSANKNRLIDRQTGSVFGAVNSNALKNFKVNIPDSEEEQDFIALILGKVDEKIELNRRMNETLEKIGQTLFKHYFIDNPKAENWSKVRFEEFTEISTGKGSTKSKLKEGGAYPLYGANGIMGTSDEFLIDEPLIITGRVGSLGNVRAIKGKVWLSDNVLFFRPRKGAFGFVYLTAKTFDYSSLNRGSTQPLITQTDLKNQDILEPDTIILKSFEEQFQYILEKIQVNDIEIESLKSLRDSILPRLISGKITIDG